MDMFLVGLSHKTAPIQIREKVAFREEAIPEALSRLRGEFGFAEAMILSTCNRVEVVGAGPRNNEASGHLRDFLCHFHSLEADQLNGHLYTFSGDDLIRHIFRVASSVDSMVVGEAQILGQLKQAFGFAEGAGAAGQVLRRLMPHAFFVAKRVRNETRIGESTVSISSVAVELAMKIFGKLDGKSVLLLGAGKMGELAAQSLLKAGASHITVANRTREKAEAVAARFEGRIGSFERLEDELSRSDIVLVSTGAAGFVVSRELVEKAIRRRRYDPLFLIDISVPRNVEPAVNEIETAFSYDIDDLQSIVDSNLEERLQEAAAAEEIILQEVRSFQHEQRHRDLGPLAQSLRHRLESICLEELRKEGVQLQDEEAQRMKRILLRAAHRIAHPLLVQMKTAHRSPNPRMSPAELLAEAFELEDKE